MSMNDHGLSWWSWYRARRRLEEWVHRVIAVHPYRVEFSADTESYIDFTTRKIIVSAQFPDALSAAARQVPTLWGRTTVATSCELQVFCARALAYHEAGHALLTTTLPAAGLTLHWLINALEDERIERLVGRVYRPAARDLSELGLRLWWNGMQETTERATALLNCCLFHRWDAKRPEESASRLVLPDADPVLWTHQIRPRVEAAWVAPDTAAVAAIAVEILHLLGLSRDDAVGDRPGLMPGSASPQGVRPPHDPARGADTLPVDLTNPVSGTGEGDKQVDSTGSRAERQQADPAQDAEPNRCLPGGTMQRSGAEIAAAPGETHGPAPGDAADLRLADDHPDCDPSEGRLPMQPFLELEASVAAAVRKLTRELRLPEMEPVALPSMRGGRFSARAYMQSRGATPFLRTTEEDPGHKALAMILLIDTTGSMALRMPHVQRATMLMQRTCASLAIPLAIGGACGDYYYCVPSPGRPAAHQTSRRSQPPVFWLQRFNTPPNTEGPRALIAGLHGAGGTEAISRSLRVAQAEVEPRPEARKVIVYIHDGESDEGCLAVRQTVEEIRRTELIVIGLHLGDQCHLQFVEESFGPSWTIGAGDVDALPALLGRLLRRYRKGEGR